MVRMEHVWREAGEVRRTWPPEWCECGLLHVHSIRRANTNDIRNPQRLRSPVALAGEAGTMLARASRRPG